MTPGDSAAMRYLLVGDVAGHLTALDDVLEAFEVSVAAADVPPGTCVVQVGDLVGRSAESGTLVASVDRIRRRHPERWVQLAGNHVLHHLGGHQFQGTDELGADVVRTMRDWLDEGWLRIAMAVEAGGSGTLVTHAGLTRGLWTELGSPPAATEAASTLEALRDGPKQGR
jgi:hypothetical protein